MWHEWWVGRLPLFGWPAFRPDLTFAVACALKAIWVCVFVFLFTIVCLLAASTRPIFLNKMNIALIVLILSLMSFQPWCNPLWLSGLKAPSNSLKRIVSWLVSIWAQLTTKRTNNNNGNKTHIFQVRCAQNKKPSETETGYLCIQCRGPGETD